MCGVLSLQDYQQLNLKDNILLLKFACEKKWVSMYQTMGFGMYV